jgi:hypothetical protein
MKIKPIVKNQHLHPILVSQGIDCVLRALNRPVSCTRPPACQLRIGLTGPSGL